MKKTPLLNSAISEAIASLGHGDMVVVTDAGLPIPPGTRRIDLALTRGVPGFMTTLSTILAEMHVERAVVSAEIAERSPQVLADIRQKLGGVPIETVPHAVLKEMIRDARAVVRTGEFTPYANIILYSGVMF